MLMKKVLLISIQDLLYLLVQLEEISFPEAFALCSYNYCEGKRYAAKDFYIYQSYESRQHSRGLWITFHKPERGILYFRENLVVALNNGEWGGGVYYFANHYGVWEESLLVADDGFVDFVYTHQIADQMHNPYGEKCYMLAEKNIYQITPCYSAIYDEQNKLLVEHIYSIADGDVICGGGWWNDTLYFVTDSGLYCLKDKEAVALSQQPLEFWEAARGGSIVMYEGNLYATMQTYGIYEYDLQTGEEKLYRIDRTPALVYEVSS